ncbi:hypothetical protein [Pseudomonas syringae]|uniref:hypothetical protein n=1 Tax=Pseudomonas syringae TaxID=317 RepID=UPI000E316D29|nr:hypothetical protein [Pseudomonas syringae]
MRQVNRDDVTHPASLSGPSSDVQEEIDAAITFYQSYNPTKVPRPKGFDFKKYKALDVQTELKALFMDKCAYCESEPTGDIDVEHFRPKGEVTEAPEHPGYWWLAHTWSNLYPSCQHCNQRRLQHIITEHMTEAQFLALKAIKPKVSYGKMNQFPIDGTRATCSAQDLTQERPHLLNPTEENPEPYFRWSASGKYSVVLAKSTDRWMRTRALTTISTFALNRLKLVQSRTRILTELRFQREQIFEDLEQDLAEGETQRHIDRAIKRVLALRRLHGPNQPYSAMVKAFIDEFEQELLNHIA